jgi:translocation and assembly module TamA
VVAESGPRYRFGELRITGLKRYSADLVERLNRSVKPGDDYREDRLLALQAALQSTPYFSSVSVSLERSDDDARPLPVRTAADGAGARGAARACPVPGVVRHRLQHQHRCAGRGRLPQPAIFSPRLGAADRRALEQLRQTAFADVFLPPDEKQRRDGVGTASSSTPTSRIWASSASPSGRLRVQQARQHRATAWASTGRTNGNRRRARHRRPTVR